MTLYDKIMALYPELTPQDFMTTIRLQNDSDNPRPTDTQLGVTP
jgi:hypothetical protein